MSKPFKCKVGIHSRYMDCVILTRVQRCNDCEWINPRDRVAAAMQERERQAIRNLPPGFSMIEARAAVRAMEQVERGRNGN